MAEVSDLVVILHEPFVAGGKWKSSVFATDARNIRTEGGVELHNAYIALTLGVASGNPDANIRIIVNDHPLPQFVPVRSDSQGATVASFPASFLKDGGGNHVELHAQEEHHFFVLDAIVHFRQNS
jgi:hypothetical protein